jgi:class 3 adenylate cyclase
VHERALLLRLLAEAEAGRSAVVVVSGVAGAGKTALNRWMAAQARERGAIVLTGTPNDELLPHEVLDRMLRPLSGPAEGATGSAAERLIDTARRRLVVLVLDDAHELDRGAARSLTEVLAAADEAALGADLRLLTAIATREPVEPGGLADRALRLDAARSLSLGGLDEHELFELFQAFGQRPDPALVTRLLEETGGLPLLVGAALEDMARAGQAGLPGSPGHHVRVRTVADALRPSLRSVDEGVLDLLRVAAVLGEPWDRGELAAVTGRSADEVRAALDAAADAGLVALDPDGGRFAHPLVRAELLRPLGAAAVRDLHRQVAERLAAAGSGDELTVRVAGHLVRALGDGAGLRGPNAEAGLRGPNAEAGLRGPNAEPGLRGPNAEPGLRGPNAEAGLRGPNAQAGLRGPNAQAGVDPALVAERAWEAGHIALRREAWHRASQLFAAAATALDAAGEAEPAAQAVRHLAAAKAAYLDDDPERCERAAVRAIAAARAGGGAPDGARTRLEAAVVLVRSRVGRRLAPGSGVEVAELRDALAAGDVEAGLGAAARATLAEALFVSGERERAYDLLDAARHLVAAAPVGSRPAGGADPLDEDPRFRVELVEGLHRLAELDLPPAEDSFRRAGRYAEPAGSEWSALTARSRRGLVRLVRGSVVSARVEEEEVERRAAARRFWGEASFAAAQLAYGAVLAGSADAEAVVARALRLFRRAGSDPTAALLAPAAAALAARRGGDDVLRATGRLAPSFSRSSVGAVLGAVEGDDVEGVRVALSSASWRSGLVGPVTVQNQSIPVALVLAGDLLGDADLVARGEGPLRALHDRGVVVTLGWPALVPRLLGLCARVAGRLDEAGRLLDHAASLGDRQELPAESALTRLEQARVAAAAGRSLEDVRLLLADAIRRFDGLGFHGWVARAEALAHELHLGALTGVDAAPRERTILTTDIVGSTEANARLGDALYVEQLRVHDRLVRTRLRELNGVEIKHTGDGINAVFDDPGDAVRAALALQADLARWYEAEPDLAFRVRCGLARGRVIPSGGDFFGLVQSEAARLCAMADPGDVIGTATVVDALVGESARGVVASSLGTLHLRGLPAATSVYRLALT